MTIHQLKTIDVYYAAVGDGGKQVEIRKNDRTPGFSDGDLLVLCEVEAESRRITGRRSYYHITNVIGDKTKGIVRGYVALSIEPASVSEHKPGH